MDNKVYTVAVTGAAGQVGSFLLTQICAGYMFGPNVKFNLQLIELPQALGVLSGVIEEIKDLNCNNLVNIFGTSDSEQGFTNADVVL